MGIGLKYDYYLFDFDGTLADSGEGIRKSVAYSLEKMNWEVPSREVLNSFIGPPLHGSYVRLGMTEAEAERAVALYRERYTETGIFETQVYPGIAQMLRRLRRGGAYVAVASGKPEVMLKRVLAHFGLDQYLNASVGVSLDRRDADKRDLIMRALPEGADLSRACMVGDRCFDMDAARALGMAAVGAGYGYGPEGELAASGADVIFDDVASMAGWLAEGTAPDGVFISLEGTDGCGKSTQLRLLNEHLVQRGFETVLTREPGGCSISERIREVILSLDSRGMSPECEALLYAASRVEHVREVIVPALKLGKIVICDRFLDSSIAYQAYGRELEETFIRQINEPAAREAFPDLTLLLEVDRQDARRRMAGGAPLDRLEMEREDFFRRVQAGYDALARAASGRIRRIDAGRAIEEVFEDVKAAVDGALAIQ